MSRRTEKWTHAIEMVVGFACDKCKAEIEPAMKAGVNFAERAYDASNPRDAMTITLGGWYGGYFDCDLNPSVLLCKACVQELLAAAPYLREVMDRDEAQLT